MVLDKNCDWCSTSFTKKNKEHRFCSTPCRKKWHKKANGEPALPDFITQRKKRSGSVRRTVRRPMEIANIKPIDKIESPRIAQLQTQINWLAGQLVNERPSVPLWASMPGLFFASKLFTDNPILQIAAAAAPLLFNSKNSAEVNLRNANLQRQIDDLKVLIIEEANKERVLNAPTPSPIQVHQDFKMISAANVNDLKNEKYLLDGQWRYFLNYLPHSFNAIIHGLPKAGKTHLALQFAQYLESKFGNVMYVSGEEGVEEPFNDKLKKYNSSFQVAYDVKGSFGIMKAIEKVKPKFVFIDSLNRLGLNVNDIISFKETFPNTVFIYIMQSTKDGKFKGGQDIAHEVTSMIKVIEGIAHQKGRTVPEPTQLAVFK